MVSTNQHGYRVGHLIYFEHNHFQPTVGTSRRKVFGGKFEELVIRVSYVPENAV